jgi:hypothetical protein
MAGQGPRQPDRPDLAGKVNPPLAKYVPDFKDLAAAHRHFDGRRRMVRRAGLVIADKGAKSEGAKMKQKSGPDKAPAEQVPKNIRRQTPKVFCGREDPHCAGRAAW